MKSNRGNVTVILSVIVVLLTIIAIAAAASYVSAFNYGNRLENQLKAVQTDNKNKLAQYGQKVLEVAQVPEMYKNDVVQVTTAAIQGRYGPDGSRATWQMIQEQNPNLDASMYKQIQQVIESGRNDFQAGQTRQIDIRRSYETALGSFWQGTWLGIAGYPKVDLKSFDIVSTGRADAAFETKQEDGPIKLR